MIEKQTAESRVDRLKRNHWLVLRWLYAGMLLGPLIAYATYIPLKLFGAAPEHATWPFVFIAPVVGFGGLAALMSFVMRSELKRAAELEAVEGEGV